MNRVRAALLFLTLLPLLAGPAFAHSLSVAHVDIDARHAGDVAMELDLSLRDVALALPLDGDGDDQVTWQEVQDQRAALHAMVLADVGLATSAGPCALSPGPLAVRRYDDGVYVVVRLRGPCPARTGWQLRYNLLFDQDPKHRALVTLHQGRQALAAVADASSRRLSLGSTGRMDFFLGFLRQGVAHILDGYDHLAFLLSLLLPAMLVRAQGRWHVTGHWRDGLAQTLGIVTAFTAAHSITLTLAALAWVTPSSHGVEAAIAASVLLAALNNVWPLITRRLWMVAFSFGLIHGFGFAGALGEAGLPTHARLAPLAGFNLGVEIGQLAVVVVLCPLLWALATRHWYVRTVMPALSVAIAGLAGWWLWERLV